MKAYTMEPASHLEDDELLRLVDDDDAAGATWRAGKQQHLASCEQCTRALAALADDGAFLRQWLDAAAFELDLPAAAQRRRARPSWQDAAWLRAAAVLLMVAAPVAAFPGLRAWISDTVTGAEEPVQVRTMAAPADALDAAAVVRFVPLPGTFTIVVDAAQSAGTLHIGRTATGAEAVLVMSPQPGDPVTEPVIAETSLRLRNTAAAAGGFTLTLPANVSRVTVSIGGVIVADLDGPALQEGAAIALGAGATRGL